MKNIQESLKKQEKKIVTTAYEIALAKQDIALGLIDAISEVFKRDSPRKFSKEEIADLIFQKVKELTNNEVMQYLNAGKQEKYKLRLKIEKKVMNSILKGK
jgi:hypothetical protein